MNNNDIITMDYLDLSKEELINQILDLKERNKELEQFKERADLFDRVWNGISEQAIVGEMIFSVDGEVSDCIILDINHSVEVNQGVLREDVIGKSGKYLFQYDDSDIIAKYGEVVRKGDILNNIEYCKRLDRWYNIQMIPLSQKYKFFIIIRDITIRKKAEETLKLSEQKYHNIFNLIDEDFCIVEVVFDAENNPIDCHFIELNPAFKRNTGYHITEGVLMSELDNLIDRKLLEIAGAVILTGEPARFTYQSMISDRWVKCYAFKIDMDKASYVAFLLNDITTEERRKEKLEELLRLQDEMYINVSHELKTPLNVIFSVNQMMDIYLKDDNIAKNKKSIIDYNRIIKQNCYRLSKLINNIVDLSKTNAGFYIPNMSNENIVEVIESIVQSVLEYAKSKNLKILFDTEVEEMLISCDPIMIERVILNLLSNAIKFTNSGGHILVNIYDRDHTINVIVRDTGIGIEKDQLDKMFLRYYQVDKSLTRNAGGSGIGLSLTKSIVELHGGTIGVESEVGKGTTFTIKLPKILTDVKRTISNLDYLDNRIERLNIEFSDIYFN